MHYLKYQSTEIKSRKQITRLCKKFLKALSSKRLSIWGFVAPSLLGKDLLAVLRAGLGERIPKPSFANLVVISPLQSIVMGMSVGDLKEKLDCLKKYSKKSMKRPR